MKKNLEDYTRVTEILSILQKWESVPKEILRKAVIRGSDTHAAIKEFLEGKFPTITTPSELYFQSFLKWHEECPILALEKRYFDEEHLITGQIDLMVERDNTPVLIDFKTSSQESLKIWELQLHFYRHLIEINGEKAPDHFMVVQLQKEGTIPKLHHFEYSPQVKEVCLKLVDVYRYLY